MYTSHCGSWRGGVVEEEGQRCGRENETEKKSEVEEVLGEKRGKERSDRERERET